MGLSARAVRWVLAGAALAVVLLPFGGPALRAGDAPIDDLVADLGAPEEHVRDQARESLVARGAAAVPALTAALGSANPRARVAAAKALGAIGAPAASAADALLEAAASPDAALAQAAKVALAAVESGGAALHVPELVVRLASRDPAARLEAARLLGLVGGASAKDAVAALVPVLVRTDADDALRAEAARSLGALGAETDSAIPPLVDALGGGTSAVRAAALDALVMNRAAAPAPALRALARILEAQADPANAQPWIDALFWDLGPFAAAPARAALESDEPYLAAAGAEALGAARAADAESLAALVAAMNGRPSVVRRRAALSLGAIGAAGAESSVDPLVALLADRESRAQVEAADALRRVLVDLAERAPRPSRTPADVQRAIETALDWLAAHQDDDGRFDCDGFDRHDPATDRSGGAGKAAYDVGVTGLAALALLRSGATGRGDGEATLHDLALRRALRFLAASQDADGCLDSRKSNHWIYGHSVAALALTEAWSRTRSPLCGHAAQRALDFLASARNPEGGWRYEFRPSDTDTSVNGWCVQALRAGERAGLRVDGAYGASVLAYLDRVTHKERGDVAYQENKEGRFESARTGEALPKFPPALTRAMTGSACLQRILLGREAKSDPFLRTGLDRVAELPPATDPPGRIDLYSWLACTEALHLAGGDAWNRWRAPLRTALLTLQCGSEAGARAGSFEPADPWGSEGGRIYSTALGALCLELHQGAMPGLPSDPTRSGRGLKAARALDAAARDGANHESVRDAARMALVAAKGP